MLELALGETATDCRQPDGCRFVREWRDAAGHPFAAAHAAPDAYWLSWPRLGLFQFAPPDRRILFHPQPAVDVALARSEFARTIQPLLLPAYGVQALHASAAATPEGAVLFAGLGGAGKSTLAFALGLESGCRPLADDAVAFTCDERAVRLMPLPFSAQLRPASASHFASRASWPSASPPAAPLNVSLVILLEQRLVPEPVLHPVPQAEAFSRVVTHAHAFDPSSREERARFVSDYMTLAARVPVMTLTYAPRFDELSRVTTLVRQAVAADVTAS